MNAILNRRTAVFATVILVVQAIVYYSGSGKETIPSIQPWNQFPSAIDGWRAVGDIPITQEVLDRLKPDDYLNRNYATSGERVVLNLFVGYFNSRRNGRAPHSPEWCLPGAGWKSLSTHTVAIPIEGEIQKLPANEFLIEKAGEKQVVLYWYHQGTRSVADDLVAQMYALPELILHGRTDTALIRIIVPVRSGDTTAAKIAGWSFAESAYPLIRKHIL